jgi:hypothetical protein
MAIVRTNWDTSTNKDAFKTLVRSWFDSTDREALVEYPKVVKTYKTSDEYERHGRYAMLDYAGELDEGENIPIQSPKFNTVKDYSQVAYGTGFRITDRMKRFNKIGLMEKLTKNLGVMMKETKDVEIAKMFNNMSATTYARGFDTLAIAHNSHTLLDDASTTYDNYLDAALSLSSLESALNYFEYMYDDQANIMVVRPDTLVVNYTLRFDADELLKSSMKPWEQSNTINVIKGELTPYTYHRLTSATCWFVIAKNHPKYGYFVYTAMEPDSKTQDASDTTRDTIVTSMQYFKYGVDDQRMLYCGDL